MRSEAALGSVLAIILAGAAWPQSEPLYRVTVVQRTVPAVNHQYRSGPTNIDFRGTVLSPDSKGDATIESKSGRTEIDARFEHVHAPSRFGAEYLTYVLWAITPEGQAKNLGDVLAGSSDKAHLHVTTDLQAFGLIVTAEPYSAVRTPSDVVVMENQVRPDTIGSTQPIHARYELMPRGSYTYNVPADLKAAENGGPRVSMHEYEALVELYQAQNALQIAESQGAEQYAPDILAKARQEFQNAQSLHQHKGDRNMVVTTAREAAQTAEDARVLATMRKHDAELAQAKQEAAREQQLRQQAEVEAQRARSQAEAERTAREQAESQAAAQSNMQTPAAVPAPPAPPPQPAEQSSNRMDLRAEQSKSSLRMELLRELNGSLQTRDTPRGLVVTVPASEIQGSEVTPEAAAGLAKVATTVAAHPGLTVQVEGNSDNSGEGAQTDSYHQAVEVREVLIRNGLPASVISAQGFGNAHPVASNSTASGREQNRRVEVVISGEPIGKLASWDRPYALTPGGK